MKAKTLNGGTALAVLAIALAAPYQATQADVLDSSATGFTLQFERTMKGDRAEVYRAMTAEIGNWWLAAHTWYGVSSNMYILAEPEGCLCERDGNRFTEHLRVVKVEPGELIRFTGGLGPLQGEGVHGVMDWQLLAGEDDQTSTLRLSYRVGGYTPNDLSKWAPAVDNVLQQQMDALQSYLSN
ncbi:SRPBCC family protein [Pseudidiomarina insulisalsae]|uniref:Polyketide cyclase/dehydrase n=1 Tax=Pseudidiomarina insulisalsae TaxID=575789 RepID=A0A432YHB1_9GAMM|nr:SRPBCC domain-containing protein [Pseudidiomarina insulisalsae]RUO60310.1 polyketide cyclase/dehydrase [Pseudidiomarina insulisalsae]